MQIVKRTSCEYKADDFWVRVELEKYIYGIKLWFWRSGRAVDTQIQSKVSGSGGMICTLQLSWWCSSQFCNKTQQA